MRSRSRNGDAKVGLDLDRFKVRYARVLRDFVAAPGEEKLLEASELGKKAQDNDIGLLDITAVHMGVLAQVLKEDPSADPAAAIDNAERVLLDCLAAFEMSARGFMDKLEEARRKSEADVKAIFASAQDGVVIFDDTGSLIDYNKAFAKILGYSREVLRERKDRHVKAGGFAGIDEVSVKQLHEYGYFDEYETELTRSDGSPVVASVSGAMIGGTREDSPWRSFAFVKDITERKRAEEALRMSEEKYRDLYESSLDGIVSLDMDGRVTGANQAYLDMLGCSLDEVRGMTYWQITPEKWHEMEQDVMETQLPAHGYSDLYEKEYIRKDGSVFPVSVRRWLMRDAQGDPVGIWSVVRDITERKRIQDELERINTELDGYAHSVSHDLRSPLSAIVLSAELLRDAIVEGDPEVLREEAREAEKTIRRSVNRSYQLIDDLLALAESGQAPTMPVEVDVAKVVSAIREERASEIEMRRAELDTSEDLGVVRASQTHIYQLFANLIGNAITHNDAASPVVRVQYQGRDVLGRHVYHVCDNGKGIPEAILDNIFKPFFKTGGSSRTGVGLAIVEKVTATYGGFVRAYNDGGACFEFAIMDWKDDDS